MDHTRINSEPVVGEVGRVVGIWCPLFFGPVPIRLTGSWKE